MRAKSVLIILAIVALGFITALISGFYERNLSRLGLSKIGYGFPVSWHGHSWIVYPGMPTLYWFSLESFLLDTIFWCLIVACFAVAAISILAKLRKTGT